ncbi:MAG: GMC family oxidoreductase, partial [Haliscomenobacter sp.]|nr:GMC family oxidoreductase [Haliscomenobacter sp.]
MYMQGRNDAHENNHVRLSTNEKTSKKLHSQVPRFGYDDNAEKWSKTLLIRGREMLEVAGCTNNETYDNQQAPGLDIHEMGGVRMGRDPLASLLNEWNQMHHCKNVFVTDGACMLSMG